MNKRRVPGASTAQTACRGNRIQPAKEIDPIGLHILPASDANLITVVIACYNQAHCVGEAIQSVLDQTHRNVEVIVVDDGSSDNSAEVASAFAGVTVLRQTNRGVVVARNEGFNASRGGFVVFLDGDDRLDPSAVENGLRCMLDHANAGFVFGRCQQIDEDGRELPMRSQFVVLDDYYHALLQTNLIWLPAIVMFRREVLGPKDPFAAFADHCCDYELYLRVARQYPVYSYDATVAQWRQHARNISHDAQRMFRAVRKVLKSQRPHVKGRPSYEAALKKGIENYNSTFGDKLALTLAANFRSGEWHGFLRTFLILLVNYPEGAARHAFRKISTTIQRRFLKSRTRQA